MPMASEKRDVLLEKYWDGQTTVEEEKELRHYFSSADIPPSLKETAVWFKSLNRERAISLRDETFNTKVMAGITRRRRLSTNFFNKTMRIAAGITVLALAIWLVRIEVRPAGDEDTFDDPDRAFEETKRALMMISRSFNAAGQHAAKINVFNEAQEEVRTQNEKPQL